MRLCEVHLESLSPYSQSAKHDTPKLDREGYDDYDERTWLGHCSTMIIDKQEVVCVPVMAWKQCFDTGAQKLGLKPPGRRGATYKNFFASGFLSLVDTPLFATKTTYHTKETATKVIINANSDGVRGNGKRVTRRFPVFNKWHGVARFRIIDNIITQPVFEEHVIYSGLCVGIGRFRPEKGGINGQFRPVKFTWEDMVLAA